MYKFEDDDGNLFTGVAKINGYCIYERPFDGIYFEADMTDGVVDLTTVRIEESSKEYFEDFNQVKWLKEAADYFENADECLDTDNGQIWARIDNEKTNTTVEPIAIKMHKLF